MSEAESFRADVFPSVLYLKIIHLALLAINRL